VVQVIDLRADAGWVGLVERLRDALASELGDLVIRMIALPSPGERIYDSNLLIVVRDDSGETVERIMDAILRVEGSAGVEGIISPLIVTESERRIIEGFINYEREEELREEDWISLLRDLCSELGFKPVRMIALPSPSERIYDSNLLIVVRDDSGETVERIMDAILRVEGSAGVEGIISPLIVTESERRIIEGFRGLEVVCE